MYQVYALHSPSCEKIYIGYSSNLNERLLSHNFLPTKGYTVKYRPWKLVYSEPLDSKKQAMIREKELKSAQGRAFIWNIIKNG